MENDSSQKIKFLAASMAAALAFLADIYLIINMPKNYPVLGVISLIFIVSLYLGISGLIKWKDIQALKWEEQYQNMVRAEKACYLLIRKNFRDVHGKVNCLDIKIDPLSKAGEVNHQKISRLLDTLMQEQKKIAKITVSRNKENANALMNSNDKVIEKMFEMQDTIGKISEVFESQPKDDSSQKELLDVRENQKKLEEEVQDMKDSLQNLDESLSSQMKMLMERLEQVSLVSARPDIPAQEILPQEELLSEDQIPSEEPEIKDSSSDEMMPRDDIAPVDEMMPRDDIAPAENIIPENSNKMLSPEEIAALIAGTQESSLEIPEPPVDIPEPVKEKPPVPDMSNPNKVMSPEDIAALIANM